MPLKDLDLLLHKINIFYRYDISKRIVSRKQLLNQKLNILLILDWILWKYVKEFKKHFDFIIKNETNVSNVLQIATSCE